MTRDGGDARRPEDGRARIVLDDDDPSPEELKSYFLTLFDSLALRPRRLAVEVVTRNDRDAAAWVDFEDGEPVFGIENRTPAKGRFSRRWLPDHPVPLRFSRTGSTHLVLEPAEGDRVRVRKATFWERFFG